MLQIAQVTHLIVEFLDPAEHQPRANEELAPAVGQLHRLAPLQQAQPARLLEIADLERDIRLTHADGRGRLRERSGLDDGDENPQRGEAGRAVAAAWFGIGLGRHLPAIGYM